MSSSVRGERNSRRWSSWRGRLPLRARLALLTAAAVAVAITACAGAAWFIVQGRLIDQLDQSLTVTPKGGPGPRRDPCAQPQPRDPRQRSFLPTIQVVFADGGSCTAPGRPGVAVTDVDIAIARGNEGATFHDATAADGTHMRVLTEPLRHAGRAISIAKPMTSVDDSLRTLALALVGVAGVGILGAAAAGLLVARAGLSPVNRLTGATEHIARTEDLNTTIPVDGHDEVARLGRSFNAMTAALANSRDRQRQLIADAGHELRTPLTSLRTNIDLLLRSEATGRELPADDRHRLLTNVKAQLLELSSLVGDLLELSKPTDAEPAEAHEVIPLHDITAAALERARLRGPELTFETDLEPWYLHGDSAALRRGVVNLLDNAVKFSPAGGTVTVALHDGELTVRDHGPGIADEDLPHVFDRFWRSPSARGLPGSGLGLAIVARTARKAGGDVTLGTAEDGGTVARMRLPGEPEPFS